MADNNNPFVPQSRGTKRVVVYRSQQVEDTEKGKTGSNSRPEEVPKNIPARLIFRSKDENASNILLSGAQEPDRRSQGQRGFPTPDDGKNLEDPSTTTWPHRLLHVKTMTVYTSTAEGSTSYQSPEGEVVAEPSYNIVSYTWGRFQASGDTPASSLPVKGIEWKIPAIDSRRAFTAEQFEYVLEQVAGGTGFAWVDVACIDQREDSKDKQVEIGNQVGIFYRAQSGYIWLHQLTEAELQEGINAVARAKAANNATQEDIKYIETMCKDPWFSSLWTLQEAYLRKTAILFSKTGVSASTPSGTIATLQWLVEACEHPWAHGSEYIKQIVRTAGLDRLSARNPVVLLAAARYRETKRPLDRIKGIMQVFGLNIGQYPPGSPEPRLSQLEDALSQALNIKSPALAQGFIHVDRADDDQAWKLKVGTITPPKRSRKQIYQRPGLDLTQIVPPDFFKVKELVTYPKRPNISFKKEIPIFDGFCFRLEDLLEMWKTELPDDQKAPQLGEWMPYMNNLTHSVYMDNGTDLIRSGKISVLPCDEAFLSYNSPLHIVKDLHTYFPNRIRVLLMGQLRDDKDVVFIGLLVERKEEKDGAAVPRWSRVGFCTWSKELEHLDEFCCSLG